jgi:RsiW-degrading membrane proteinase PrsW (M82 family)
MSQSSTSLSILGRFLYYLGPPVILYFVYSRSPKVALATPITFIPTAVLYNKWREANITSPSRRGELEPLLWTYVATIIVCLIISLPQIFMLYVLANMFSLADEEMSEFMANTSSWRKWAFLATFTFCTAATEEGIKYLSIVYARRRNRQRERSVARTEKDDERRRQTRRFDGDRAYIDYAIACGLGFGIFEAVGYLFGQAHKSNIDFIRALAERLIGCVGHVTWILPTALRAIRRDFPPPLPPSISSASARENDNGEAKRKPSRKMSWFSVIGPGVLMHWANNFTSFGTMTLMEAGWISLAQAYSIIFLVMICLYVMAGWVVRRECRKLNDDEKKIE